MPIDFAQALELAKTLFAGISAAAAAITTWRSSRNKEMAAATFDLTLATTRDSSEAREAAQQLLTIIPHEVMEDLEVRADQCWTSYRSVLGGEYLPDEVDNATVAVRACVCRELRHIYELNGSIPGRWQGQWELYRCTERDSLLNRGHLKKQREQRQTASVRRSH